MKIFETRGKIKDIKDARDAVEKIGGISKGYYCATDIIFKPKKIKSEKEGSDKGIIDLRVFKINNRQTKNYAFVHKIAEWHDNIKTDKVIVNGRFDTIREVLSFMNDNYGEELKMDFGYSREGWEYREAENNIFIERIEKLGPTVEIEAENKGDIERLSKIFGVIEYFREPVPEIMRKLIV